MNWYSKATLALLIFIAIAPVSCLADQLNVAPDTVAKGTILSIDGSMDGSETVQIWIFGKNYWNGAATGEAVQIATGGTGTFSYQLSDTSNLAAGQYYVVAQSPGSNGVLDVFSETTYGNPSVSCVHAGIPAVDKHGRKKSGRDVFIVSGLEKTEENDFFIMEVIMVEVDGGGDPARHYSVFVRIEKTYVGMTEKRIFISVESFFFRYSERRNPAGIPFVERIREFNKSFEFLFIPYS